MPEVESQTYTVAQAARILNVSAALIYRAITDNELPVIRLGTIVRIHRVTVDKVLNGEIIIGVNRVESHTRRTRERAKTHTDPDVWAEKQARELEIRTKVKGGDLY